MLRPYINDRPMAEIGRYGSVEYTEEWLHGCTEATWQTTPGAKHGRLEMGALVQIRDKGWPVWSGILSQPGTDGMLHARGLWTQAQTVAATDSLGNPTYIPDVAIVAAINRGALNWRLPDSVSGVPAITDGADSSVGVLMISDLLDKWAEASGKRWGVNGRREVYTSSWPELPSWIVAPGESPMTPADDDMANGLIGKFLVAEETYQYVTVTNTLSRERWGTREVIVDLTKQGVLTVGGAVAILNGILANGSARMGWAEPIQVAPGELQNMGGATGRAINVGDGVRVLGVFDPSWMSTPRGYIDLAASRIQHRADGSLVIDPAGKASRAFREVLADALEGNAS